MPVRHLTDCGGDDAAGAQPHVMDQETARTLVRVGATFVLEHFPVGSEFGIDLNVYTVGEKFKGVKMIPPGVHFIYFSCLSDHDHRTLAPRCGLFKVFTTGEVCLKKWDRSAEDIDDREISEDEVSRYRDNVMGSLDQFLAPYDLASYEKWSGLTDYISAEVVDRLNPATGRINSVTELIPQSFTSSSSCRQRREQEIEPMSATCSGRLTSDRQEDRLLPAMQTVSSAVIHFSQIGSSRLPADCSAADVTKLSLDSSHVLQSLVTQAGGCDSVLGEVQFAFVCFLVGHVHDAFEHWKKLLRLICSSNHALQIYNSFFLNFVRVLHFQVQEVPPDFFVDIVSSNNFLLMTLRDLFFNSENNDSVSPDLRRRGARFRASLEKKFKWDFSVELSDDDEAPVIVASAD